MELLIWVVDKNILATEPATGVGGYFAGDLIIDFPDGHHWQTPERSESRWRILRVPLTAAQQTLVDNLRRPKVNISGYIWLHGWFIDKALLPAAIQARMTGATDGQIIDVTVAQLQAAAVQKPAR